MIKKLLFLSLLNLAFLYSIAQVLTFEQMKSTLNEYSLPLVNISADVSTVSKYNFTEADIEICDFLERTTPGQQNTKFKGLVRYRGASSIQYEKKSFALKLIDESGDDLDANVLGIRYENSWILDAMAIDRLRMRNRVCFDVWNEMSKTPYVTSYQKRNGTEGYFVELFLNGNYHGIYCLSDKIDRKLLGLKKLTIDTNGETLIRGVLYKGITWGSGIYLTEYAEADTNKKQWNSWELQYPEDSPSRKTWEPLMNLIDFCTSNISDNILQPRIFKLFLSRKRYRLRCIYIST